MHWGPEEPHEGGFLEELARFVSARDGSGPAVLWPECDPASVGGVPAQDLGSVLADGLAGLLGRAVVRLAAGPPTGTFTQLALDQGELVVLQESGASGVEVAPGGEPDPADATGDRAKPLVLRLLRGEVLYLPPGSRAVLRHEPGTRHVLLRIAVRPAEAR
ncbi:hypothetical protein ACIQOW_10130 [Kitasatospora sp. NPDC091335]|uniref:hypothetical protein n=1 Tax=Kitasatospora sp. NPDC091335 TaxID=3364085 RepID=UPI00380FE768